MAAVLFEEKDFLACYGSTRFVKEMASAALFASYQYAVDAARDIWFTKAPLSVSVNYLIGTVSVGKNLDFFIIFASGRSTHEILSELKRRFQNKPIVEFENTAMEQMKVIELRLTKLFSTKAVGASTTHAQGTTDVTTKSGEDRASIIGAHLTEAPVEKPSQISTRTRPPITTHVLNIARGSPTAGVEVRLDMWKGNQPRPTFGETETGNWVFEGSSNHRKRWTKWPTDEYS